MGMSCNRYLLSRRSVFVTSRRWRERALPSSAVGKHIISIGSGSSAMIRIAVHPQEGQAVEPLFFSGSPASNNLIADHPLCTIVADQPLFEF